MRPRMKAMPRKVDALEQHGRYGTHQENAPVTARALKRALVHTVDDCPKRADAVSEILARIWPDQTIQGGK